MDNLLKQKTKKKEEEEEDNQLEMKLWTAKSPHIFYAIVTLQV